MGTEVLDYAQITAGVNLTATAEATPTTVITGADIVLDGATEIIVEFYCRGLVPAAGAAGEFSILNLHVSSNGGASYTDLGRIAAVQTPSITAGMAVPVYTRRKLTPAAGTYRYRVVGWVSSTTGAPAVQAGTGGAGQGMPAFLRVSNGRGAVGATGPTGATGAAGAGTTHDIAQTAHGLAVGDVVRYSGSAYVKAQADSAVNAEVVGIVSAVADANNFTLRVIGQVTGLSGLTAGTVYFLSPATAGLLTATEPTTSGQVSKPLLIAYSTTAGYFFNFRGALVQTTSPIDLFLYAVAR